MFLCRVKGSVTATVKHECFKGWKVMVVQPITADGKDKGDSFLACDPVQSGPGDVVLAAREGNTARQLLGKESDPFHAVIVGIVDRISVKKEEE